MVYEPDLCVNPITNLTIDSHNDGDVVTNSPITLFGTVVGGVQSVTVTVNGTPYTATVNGQNWSVIVQLNPGDNVIVVTATPLDPDCDVVTKKIFITYHPDVCVDPITNFTIDSHFSGQVVTSSPILLTGTVQGGVDHISVMVNGGSYLATIVGNVWSVTVPLLP
ncbi:MAG: hypothetical protein H6765_09360 [Candidatus Peribacteria bacterium]|nr:MAG: hypothetical protein H6765_09360 [Candidatus Peribacteria bacterium]